MIVRSANKLSSFSPIVTNQVGITGKNKKFIVLFFSLAVLLTLSSLNIFGQLPTPTPTQSPTLTSPPFPSGWPSAQSMVAKDDLNIIHKGSQKLYWIRANDPSSGEIYLNSQTNRHGIMSESSSFSGASTSQREVILYSPIAGAGYGMDTATYFTAYVNSFVVTPNVSYSNLATVNIWNIPDDGAENAGNSCENGMPAQEVGMPVNVITGNMWLEQTDYVLAGVGEFININRFYNSILTTTGLFGKGWSTQYDESLVAYGDYSIRINMSDGRAVYLGRNNINDPFTLSPQKFTGIAVKNPDGSYTFTDKGGSIHQFSPTGKLIWLKDRQGNQTNLTYNGSNQLVQVTDPFGRTLNLTPNPNGTVAQISDALGVVANYNYNPDGTLQSVIYPDNSQYQFEYVGIGGRPYLATVKDALNNILETHQYNAQGRATTSERHGGVDKYIIDYSGNSAGYPQTPYTTVTDGLGRQKTYRFLQDQSNSSRYFIHNVIGGCDCGGGGQSISYQYDDNFNVKLKTDALGRQTSYTYSPEGNMLTETGPLGTQSFTYNQFSQILTMTDRMNGVWTNSYDPQGKLLTSATPLNTVTTLTYTPQGQVATIKDARNKVTTFNYDTSGRLASVRDANLKFTTYTYDARSRLASVKNALNFTTTFEYDLNNRINKVINPDLTFSTSTYDLAGRRITATDPKNLTTTFGYDNAYRLVAVTDPLNHTTQIGYDLMSNVTAQVDALGNTTNFEYDAYDRLIKTIYPAETVGATRLFETYEYDAVGNLKKKIDTANRQTTYNYDNGNRLINSTDPNLKVTQFGYNPRNQLVSVTDALNQVYQFTYDPLGRMLTQTRAGSTQSYTYDPVGNQISRTDYKNVTTNYVYDNLNRLTNINYPIAAENITYTYDNLSRMLSAVNYAGTTSMLYTNRNWMRQVIDVHGQKVNYTFDANGNPTRMRLNDIDQIVYTYDNANRLTRLRNAPDAKNVNYVYDDADRLISKALPNTVTTTYTYDGMSRLKQLKEMKGAATLYDRQYTYDQASNISSINQPTGAPTGTKNYVYDLLDRLTQVTGAATENYGYDFVGNRTTSHLSTTYQYVAYNRMSQATQGSFIYDSNGNMTSKTDASGTTQYIWDYENRLRQVIKPDTTSINYKYDALGRRSERYIGTVSTKFTYDGEDVILDANSDGTSTRYINGLGIDDKLAEKTGTTLSYYIQDHLGSTVALTNDTGVITSSASYDSFGNATGTVATRYQYTGREYDATVGLYYYRNRFYDAKLGRFLSEDPIGLAGGINQFGYVEGNPLSFSDPMGLEKGPGSRLADRLEGNIETARKFYQRDPQHWVWNGIVDTVSDVAKGFADVFRLGSGIGCAIYAENISPWERAGLVFQDVSRAATIAGGVWGAGTKAAGALSRAGKLSRAESKLANCLLCFEADTEVQTEDGEKPISEISIGDKVLSYNTESGEMSYQPVTEKFTRFADDIYSLKIEGEEKPLKVTSEHPFYTKVYKDGFSGDADWKEVKDLKVDNEIKLSSGKWAKILEIKFKGKGQVYNFSVAENHNYFVGDSRLLTHNTPGCPRVGTTTKQITEVPLDDLNPLHSVPRPGKPQNYIENLSNKLKTEGFDVNQAIPVIKMPDGRLVIAGGHHRVAAMKLIGETTIPSRVVNWNSLSSGAQRKLMTSFPNFNW